MLSRKASWLPDTMKLLQHRYKIGAMFDGSEMQEKFTICF